MNKKFIYFVLLMMGYTSPVFSVTYQDIIQEYNNNQARFHKNYAGKSFNGEGAVQEVIKDMLVEGFNISINTGDVSVFCANVDRNTASLFNKGQLIAFEGTVYDVFLGHVLFNNCKFGPVKKQESQSQYNQSTSNQEHQAPAVERYICATVSEFLESSEDCAYFKVKGNFEHKGNSEKVLQYYMYGDDEKKTEIDLRLIHESLEKDKKVYFHINDAAGHSVTWVESVSNECPNDSVQQFPASSQNEPIAQPPRPNHEPNPTVQSPTVKEGDSYTFESKDPEDTKSTTTTKRTVKSVGATIQLSNININNKNAKARNLTYDRDWNLISTRNADKSGADYSPPLKYYDFPLKSGNSWNQSSIETDIKSGKKRTHTITGAVDGWENVSVPAGNFRAIKVSLQTEISDPNTGEIIHGTDVSWFVPEIGRSVKSITSSQDGKKRIIQLIGYELADRK